MKAHMTRASWRDSSTRGSKSRGRRVALLKRIGLFGGRDPGMDIHRAATLQDLREAYRLVHDVYVEQGYIHPQESGLRIRAYEALPDTATFVAKVDGRVVGVMSLVMDNPELGLPSDGAFRAELDLLRGEGRQLCEVTNQVVAPEHRRGSMTTELMRCAFAHAVSAKCTDLIGTVSPSHVGFYEMLGMAQVSPVRSYSEEITDPVTVVWMDVVDTSRRWFGPPQPDEDEVEGFLRSYYVTENPYHRQMATWRLRAEKSLAGPTSLQALLVEDSELLPR